MCVCACVRDCVSVCVSVCVKEKEKKEVAILLCLPSDHLFRLELMLLPLGTKFKISSCQVTTQDNVFQL